MPSKLGLFIRILMAPLPSFLKVPLYRHIFGYQIGNGVRIGISVIAAGSCAVHDRVKIGHFNIIYGMGALSLGPDSVIGHFNLILGGDSVELRERSVVGRFNEINSIINPLRSTSADPKLIVGEAAVITAWHKIDYTDRVEIGENAIVAGRLSSLWTHNRQQTMPIRIGRNCYVGSGIQMVPGSSVGDYCIVGLGSVITKPINSSWSLIAGVPARVIRPLEGEARAMVEFPTRPEMT
jgi:Carbonic anhydrases/acetyltransferases, isoleucine patch superfamily